MDFTKDELHCIIKVAASESMREELREALLPIRDDVKDIKAKQVVRDTACAEQCAQNREVAKRVAYLEDREEEGDKCKGCINRDRILVMEKDNADFKDALKSVKKMYWSVMGTIGLVVLKELVLYVIHNQASK